jgi:hypothetical protein
MGTSGLWKKFEQLSPAERRKLLAYLGRKGAGKAKPDPGVDPAVGKARFQPASPSRQRKIKHPASS